MDLTISAPGVSRAHCCLKVVEDGVVLEHLSETNPTRVNGIDVGTGCLIQRHALLTIGGERILLTMGKQRSTSSILSERLVGDSAATGNVRSTILRYAMFDFPVLILGERGTGKSLIAELLHDHSHRRGRSIVKRNCAGLDPHRAESDLFGHKRSAYSGALEDRKGAFRTADASTLFLDEIGTLDSSVQAKLLTAVEKGEILPLGADSHEKVDVRLIAATNEDLEAKKLAGSFREDLASRLEVLVLRLPPLRERRQDIPALTDWFLRELEVPAEVAEQITGERQLADLMSYDWPNNVRGLQNHLKRCYVMGRYCSPGSPAEGSPGSSTPSSVAAPACSANTSPTPERMVDEGLSYNEAKKYWERRFDRELLTAAKERYGTATEAAKALGIGRSTFHTKLRRSEEEEEEEEEE